VLWIIAIVICLGMWPAADLLAEDTATPTTSAPGEEKIVLPAIYTPEQIDAILARLSDDQVRRLLLDQLRQNATIAQPGQGTQPDSGITSIFQRLENSTTRFTENLGTIIVTIGVLPADFRKAFNMITDGKGWSRFFMLMVILAAIFLAAWGIEKMFMRKTAAFRQRMATIPPMAGWLKAGTALIRTLPEWLGIFAFAISSLLLFLVFGRPQGDAIRLFFVAILAAILIPRIMSVFFRVIYAPLAAEVRVLPVSDKVAEYMHSRLARLFWVLGVGFMGCALLTKLGICREGFVLSVFLVVTVATVMVAYMIWQNRSLVADGIRVGKADSSVAQSWFREQLAGIWHFLAIGYLLLVWLVWTMRLVITGAEFDGTFAISVLIIPIYLVLDRVAQWVIGTTVSTLQTTGQQDSENPTKDTAGEKTEAPPPDEQDPNARYALIAHRIVRVIIILALAFWLLSVWGFQLPFGTKLTSATFDILVTLVLAHVFWKITLQTINRKLKASAPEPEDQESEDANEWASMVKTREQTILPLLRKFIGIVLVVMVTMIILSSIGVNIGPLLAGAGVVGLAIGFGAQKLVSDILSGVFFLIDDAFRVGEFIESDQITGSVEEISLRTVKLRHYRGMLQFVPFGELGTITNFMRGDLITKFNIEVPYGTNINKVRKIIKKVGQKMMEDPENGPDIIQPPKSQGVRKVGNSALTIRVKFTAKPGKHFLIRRAAFSQITEALAAAGIEYAHRKVIVEVPPTDDQAADQDQKSTTPATGVSKGEAPQDQKGISAGAGAALGTILDDEEKEKGK
jgi:small-conductance mechanosensitive channel